jgi:hypothetical protein
VGKLYNLARMTTATTGTGNITLAAAVSGYLTFDLAGVQSGDVVSYGIKDGANSEVGTAPYTTSGTLLGPRTVTKSTNANAAINLSGLAEVFITPRKEDLISVSEAQIFTAAEQRQARDNIGAPGAGPDVIIEDQKASTTSGGTSATGLNTRVLNTLVRNVGTLASLSSNQFTLPAGSYYISWSAPIWRGDQHLTTLRNVTDGFFAGIGTPEYSPSAVDTAQTRSFGSTIVTIAAAKAFSIFHQVTTGRATNGLGLSIGAGLNEVYTRVEITRIP